MAESKKNSIVVVCSIIGCIVTLLTCGTLIGKANSDIANIGANVYELTESQKIVESRVTAIETDTAFQKGIVQTQLMTQGAAIVRIEKKLDDLVRAD